MAARRLRLVLVPSIHSLTSGLNLFLSPPSLHYFLLEALPFIILILVHFQSPVGDQWSDPSITPQVRSFVLRYPFHHHKLSRALHTLHTHYTTLHIYIEPHSFTFWNRSIIFIPLPRYLHYQDPTTFTSILSSTRISALCLHTRAPMQ